MPFALKAELVLMIAVILAITAVYIVYEQYIGLILPATILVLYFLDFRQRWRDHLKRKRKEETCRSNTT